MFGYVRPDKAELKIKDYETYKAVYCSLCKTLGRHYGLLSRFFLNYDATFYVFLMKTVLQQNSDCAHRGVCGFNPLKKCNYIDEDIYLDNAAALTIIMSYYKVKDDIEDSSFFKKSVSCIIYPYIKIKYNKALKKYSQFDDIIKVQMDSQAKVENEKSNSIDKACDPSASALSEIFSLDIHDETQKRIVQRICYCLGRWVYLVDAFDDIEKDIKSGSYNPFVLKYSLTDSVPEKVNSDIIKSIRLTANEAALAFELLNKNCYGALLENIVFDGMENQLVKIIDKKNEVNR